MKSSTQTNITTAAALVILTVLATGCATKPENITPAYISHVTFSNWSCEQLGEEQMRLASALSAASDAQRKARSNDTVGVIFLGLPVSSLSGANQASNIGRLKGEMEAIQKAMIHKNCSHQIITVDSLIAKKKDREAGTKEDGN